MLPEGLQALLVLQERDSRKSQLDRVLAAAPRDRAAVEARIVAHRGGIEAAKKAVIDLELKRKELESNLRTLEGQIQRYRSQQVQVKKNDEYQALSHEIERTEQQIGAIEEQEIELLYALDEEKARCAEAVRILEAAIGDEQAQLARLAEREREVRGEMAAAQAEVDGARAGVLASLLPRYDQLVRSAGLPVVVPLRGAKCGGCHLKVSNGIETDARTGTKIVTCDNCGRIVFFEF